LALISVVVTTKDRAPALDLVLRSLARQTDTDFEVVVADDGSGIDTARVVTRWTSRLPVPLAHVWHAGPGLAEIRNRAVRASAGDYLVFLEGDCLARPGFVAAHRHLAEPGWFVTGNRILLSHELTARVLEDGLELERYGFANWLDHRSRRRAAGRFSLRSALRGLVRRLTVRPPVTRGSNIAFWRADLTAVDGFDAAYPGIEAEAEIFVRLLRAGLRRKEAGFATAVLHLWHPETEQAPSSDPLDTVLGGARIRAKRGMSALVPSTAKASG
jgi:glycosyltransferase involved in cell wall biosynthesis